MTIESNIKDGIQYLFIDNKEELYKSFMPFITYGGLFIPTSCSYQLGEEIHVLLTLLEDENKIPITGKVIWITPKAAQGIRVPGVGIQLTADDDDLVKKIQSLLASVSSNSRRTHTI